MGEFDKGKPHTELTNYDRGSLRPDEAMDLLTDSERRGRVSLRPPQRRRADAIGSMFLGAMCIVGLSTQHQSRSIPLYLQAVGSVVLGGLAIYVLATLTKAPPRKTWGVDEGWRGVVVELPTAVLIGSVVVAIAAAALNVSSTLRWCAFIVPGALCMAALAVIGRRTGRTVIWIIASAACYWFFIGFIVWCFFAAQALAGAMLLAVGIQQFLIARSDERWQTQHRLRS